MIPYKNIRQNLLNDPEVLKEYKMHQAEFDISKALIKARVAAHMTQQEVALEMKTSQAQIARLESGGHMPSFHTLHKYARATGQKLTLEINP